MEIGQRLEVHYHLRDDAHSMNAFIRNKCEAEALEAFRYMADQLGFDVLLESSAITEGGLREVWTFIVKTEHLGFANTLLAGLALMVAIWNAPAKPDPALEEAQKELVFQQIKEKKLVIAKLEQEARAASPPPSEPPAAAVENTERSESKTTHSDGKSKRPDDPRLQLDLKMRTRRSNFYKALLPYDKVIGVGLGVIPPGQDRAEAEAFVPRSNFPSFILQTDKLPSLFVADAVIEIVAPVIREGDIQWKGVWGEEVIGFAMGDKAFKDMVLRREVSFQHGDAIQCILEIRKKLDATGEAKVVGYAVDTVLAKIEGNSTIQTPQGRAKRFYKKHADAQADIFGDNTRPAS